MKRKTGRMAAYSLAAAVAVGAAVGFLARGEMKLPQAAMEPASSITASEQQSLKPRYLLGAYQGKLAVYIIGKKEPELVFDRFLHYLPDVDREKLEEGIEVAEYSELMRLIEDYTS